MTPGARVSAAIEILDPILAGASAEQVLTRWARSNRFAGSGDRAGIRDLVFDALRRRRSCGALGGGDDGRALMIGLARAQGTPLETLFTGEGHAPPPLDPAEAAHRSDLSNWPDPVRLDMPDWLLPELRRSLGGALDAVCNALKDRAPVFVRVNLRKGTQDTAIKSLLGDGIGAVPHPLAPTALVLTDNPRRLRNAAAYTSGLVELQDVASQAVTDTLMPLSPGARVLDYCAGGGGKALAIAAASKSRVYAHDANPARMSDLPDRAARANTPIEVLAPGTAAIHGPFDIVFADVPCSGSGAWRRQPQAKWTLSPEKLDELCALQAQILDEAAQLVAPGGRLAYATCSVLAAENTDQIAAFEARTPDWRCTFQRQFSPLEGGDGFFVAHLLRK